MSVNTSRRRPLRARDIASNGRRTPRFDLVTLRKDARDSALGNDISKLLGEKRKNLIKIR